MRFVLVLILLLLPGIALADDWGGYANPRFGYTVDIPPGFVAQGEADNGDGQIFNAGNGRLLRVYGGNALESSFEDSVNTAMGNATDAGWTLSYQRVTPSWASYSGSRNGMILYARAIALCGGRQFASFELEYPRADLEPMNAVVDRLVHSLKPAAGSAAC